MKNLLKNKLFIIVIMFIVTMFSFFSISKASNEYSFNDGDMTILLSDEQLSYKTVVFFYNRVSGVRLFNSLLLTNGTLTRSSENDISYTSTDTIYVYELSCSSSDTLLDYSKISLDSFKTYESSISSSNLKSSYLSMSTADIYDTSGNLVFQGAPQQTQTNLAQVVEQAETEKTLAEILGIIPVVMVVIVALLAMRKALAFLQKLFRKS